ncbi:MAG TPA: HAMP domain-containing sensor histidine kinase, partial [Gemmatimonadaceae bacterium]|nr:HAMP domain-containing sensor histidine kinase [Gemmatimonadaceae bacterium]
FAAFQLKNATIARVQGSHRAAFDLVVRRISTRGPNPPLGAERVAELVEDRREQCRCLEGVSFYYQVTFADSAIDVTASELATPGNLRHIRDTVIAQAEARAQAETRASSRPELPLPPAGTRVIGVPITAQVLVAIFSRLGDRPYLFTHAVTIDTVGKPVVAYGLAVPAELPVGRAVRAVLASQPILPTTLTRGLRVDSILGVTVTTPSREVVYRGNTHISTRYAASDSLEARLGGLHFQVAIDPAAAGRLIIGGLPRTRLPEVLATALLSVGLLGLLLYQFRRQEELGRLRNDFVSGVSHELRTPLAQIRLLAELLRMGKVPTDDQKERSLRIIVKEARRLSFLVDSILSFTHSEPGQLSPVSTDIAAEVEEIVSGFEPLAHAHGVQLTPRLQRGIVADVDRGALRQVVLNLLDNAVRYGPPRQNVTITTASEGGRWTLEVADEGPGVPVDERERIFDPYYRMNRDAGGAVGGTGIGLAVVRRLVAEHNGQVHVAPVNGNRAGARFVVSLPMNATGMNGR